MITDKRRGKAAPESIRTDDGQKTSKSQKLSVISGLTDKKRAIPSELSVISGLTDKKRAIPSELSVISGLTDKKRAI
ncbi:hypothetical protein, partial [Gracilibacillus alcaliphilus]|uniref:hypothetical protein n=1 Tax=Gracilibacillus alcaliphilus TaxID=1401441 RepID=UPI00195E1C9C